MGIRLSFLPHMPLALFAALTLLIQASGIAPAEQAHAEAVRALARNDAAAAEAGARRALAASSRFLPEHEIEVEPEKGVVFDEMIEAARIAYRRRRARYFQSLGLALTARERWAEARKVLRRSAGLHPAAEVYSVLASHPDITIERRVESLIRAYFAPGADPQVIEEALMDTGAFASPQVLQAVFDRERYSRSLAAEFPDLEIVLAPFPDVRVATTSGTLVSADLLAEGGILVSYFPVSGCSRCSEQLDGVRRGLDDWTRRGEPELVVAAFVDEQDLEDARRIVRLLGMSIEVGRADRVPTEIAPAPGGEIVIVARRGLMQVRIPLDEVSSSRELERRVAAAAELLDERRVAVPSSESTDRPGDDGRDVLEAWIDRAVALEAGPVPPSGVFQQIDDELRRRLREATAGEAMELLGKLARLRGAGVSKARALRALDQAVPEAILAAVKESAPDIVREARAEEGVFHVGSSDETASPRLLLQRSFLEGESVRHFNLIVDLQTGPASVVWVGPEPGRPSGVQFAAAGAVFFFAEDGCRGLRLVGEGGLLYQGCPAHVEGRHIVEAVDALVDPVPRAVAPRFYRRIPMNPSQPALPESALEQGLRLFREGSYRDAIARFELASREIDPVAPYDETDLRYNIARCYQELGEGPRALEIMESIGDAAYQDLVDERIDELAVATRR